MNEVEELRRIDSEWAAAAAAGEDVDRIVSFWADDAVLIPPATPLLAGRDAIREFVATSLATPGFSINWQTTRFEVAESRDLAYGVGSNRVTFPGEAGEPVTVEGRGVAVWRKENGGWRCVVDIWNDAPPAD